VARDIERYLLISSAAPLFLLALAIPAVSRANYSPPERIYGALGAGAPVVEETDGITVAKVRTSIRVHPLYTRFLSRYWIRSEGAATEVAVGVPFVDEGERPQRPLLGAVLRAGGEVRELAGCGGCGGPEIASLVRGERQRYKTLFSDLWEVLGREMNPRDKDIDEYRCCLHSASAPLRAGVNVIEVDAIADNNTYYLPHYVGGKRGVTAFGYVTANLLADPRCAARSGEAGDLRIVMRILGHPEWRDDQARYDVVEVQPAPQDRRDNRMEWKIAAPCLREHLRVFVPFDIDGSGSSYFSPGEVESDLSARPLEEYLEHAVPRDAIAETTSSSHKRNRSAAAAFDGDPIGTAWENDPAKEDGALGVLGVAFREPTPIREIGIVPGRWQRETSYRKSGRPRRITVRADGATVLEIELADRPWSVFAVPVSLQLFELPEPVIAQKLALEITDAYPGKSANAGAAIGEVLLFSTRPPSPLDIDFPDDPPEVTGSEQPGEEDAVDGGTTEGRPGAAEQPEPQPPPPPAPGPRSHSCSFAPSLGRSEQGNGLLGLVLDALPSSPKTTAVLQGR